MLVGCQSGGDALNLNAHMQRGVNLQLAQDSAHQGQASGLFQLPAVSDLELIRSLGFQHVRIRVNPIDLMGVGTLKQDRLATLRQVLNRINKQGLAVILTTQPDTPFKSELVPESPAVATFANFWRALAKALADIDPQWLVFEPLNEPEHEDARVWQAVQERLVGAVRAGAPVHRIIVAGHKFSSIPQLLEMRPLPYDNLLYSFHFYDPHNFTHQGANWGWPMWRLFHDWPYPATLEDVEPLLPEHAPAAREHLAHYGRQAWDKAKLAEELDRAVAWAERNNVELICTEFGAYRDGIEARYRLAWLADVADLLKARGINWTLWDYSGNFGIVAGEVGSRELDTRAVRALGM